MIESVAKALKAGNDHIACVKTISIGGVEMELPREVISKKSKQLIKKTEEILSEQIGKLRKRKAVPGKYLEISKYHKKNKANVTVRPLYNSMSFDNSLLIEIKKSDSTEIININRLKPEKFKYEKMVPTKSGSATTKTYDSVRQKDESMETKIDSMLQEYLSIFFQENKKHNYIIEKDIV